MALFLFLLPAIIGLYVYLRREIAAKREQKTIERRNQIQLLIDQHLSEIKSGIHSFFSNSNDNIGYFTNYELAKWQAEFSNLFQLFYKDSTDGMLLELNDGAEIETFLSYYNNGSYFRNEYNKQFVRQELTSYSKFFDNVENRKLDIQQRTAIVTDEDNNIIIAGAGSGKTTTIVGKVGYVINRYKIPAEEILLISFTNKSATTLAARINIPGVEAKTFHKFGLDVISAVEKKQPSLFDDKQFNRLIGQFFKELCHNQAYLNKVTTYFTNFLKPYKPQDEFKDQGEYYQYLKDKNFSTYKTKTSQFGDKVTIKREVVKSMEECRIANFLLFNGIEYEYERPYVHETATKDHRQYKPDFTITPTSKPVYLEHFGIGKNGKVADFFADKSKGETVEDATNRYTDERLWKKHQHEQYGTILIETFSHEMIDEILFDNLTKNLEAAGVQLRPKPPEEVWEIIGESAKDEVDSLITLFQTFITLMKSNNYSINDVSDRNKDTKDKFQRQRNEAFIEIIAPIYAKYQGYLAERKEIDFSDMINKATDYIATGQYRKKLSYIIIDEFQDISVGRYQLVKAIKNTNPACKLFCVGDDWQSIYRFAGSDITLFKDFEKYFGYSEAAKIETTYRFNKPLIDYSSKFILKNPNQTKKELKGLDASKTSNYKIVYSLSENEDDTQALQSIFDELLLSGKASGKDVLILGRYSFDLARLKNEEGIFQIDRSKGLIGYTRRTDSGVQKLSAQFMTVHKSKGLEADIIIVINCNSGRLGFPSGITDDTVLNLLLSQADQFENGEERRLFYVAMTRAKEMVYFVANSNYKSKFITELEVESKDSSVKKCPRCGTADLVKKSGRKEGREWSFYGCSNFIYGCTYRQ